MEHSAKIYVAGHRGLVGSAITRALHARGFDNLLLRTRSELDLADTGAVNRFFSQERPEYVFDAAARVGGIMANAAKPAEFLIDNLRLQDNILTASHRFDARKLLFLGSTCIYPKFAPQPIQEESLLTGPLEPTNSAYAIAKIAGITYCQSLWSEYGKSFISVMPTNLYGVQDNFDLETSHVLPAMLRRFHVAAVSGADSVTVWGTGTPRREFLHVDDLADACLFLMERYESPEIVNIGVGEDVSILDLAELIARITGFTGGIRFDHTKPDGTPRKLLDVTKLTGLGWKAQIALEDGIRQVYSETDRSSWLSGQP